MQKLTLMEVFRLVPDPRIHRTRKHNLIDIIVIAVCGALSGCQGWVEIVDYAEQRVNWFKTFLELPGGIPSHDTFGRVFSLLDPEAFQKAFYDWLRSTRDILSSQHISIDGKFLRGSLKESRRPRSAIQLVSAWSTELGICLGHKKSELKKEEGEKRIMEELIQSLYLKGSIVTLDANGATERIVTALTAKGAEYIIGLKDNQATVKKIAELAFNGRIPVQSYETIEKDHGRIEQRLYELVEVKKQDFPNMEQAWDKWCSKFNNLKSFTKVTSSRTIADHTSTETRYYFGSLTQAQPAAESIRSHWGVENKLHRTLDVDFREDHCQIRAGHAAENLGLIRRMAINMLKQETSAKKSIRRKQMTCMLTPSYLQKVLGVNANSAS